MPNRDISDRLAYCTADPLLARERVDFIVVDDGSEPIQRARHAARCAEFGLEYRFIDSEALPVNMARARNAGVAAARTQYIMFMDVDLYPYPGYYNAILEEIDAQRLPEHEDDLVMTGVVYLSEAGTKRFFETDAARRRELFLRAEAREEGLIEKVSTGTSVTLMHRKRYVELGGYDESFEWWGYEDIEYNLRHIYHSDRFPLPEDFQKEIGHLADIDVYRGWKSLYRLYGDVTYAKRIVLFHIWHDIDRGSDYAKGYEANRQRFVKKMAALVEMPRLEAVRTGRDDPLFDRYRGNASNIGLFDRYRNSPVIVWMQPLKRIPLVGRLLLRLKHFVFGEHR